MNLMKKIATIAVAIIFLMFSTPISASEIQSFETEFDSLSATINISSQTKKQSLTNENDEVEIPLHEESSIDSEVIYHLNQDDEVRVIKFDDEFSFIEFETTEDDTNVIYQGYVLNNYLNFETETDLEIKDEATDDDNTLTKEDSEQNSNDNENNADFNNDTSEESLDDEKTEIEDKNAVGNNEEVESDEIDVVENNEDVASEENNVDEDIEASESTDDKLVEDDEENSKNDADKKEQETKSDLHNKVVTHSAKGKTVDKTYYGIALNSPTVIYSDTSTSSKSLKTYKQGAVLKYQAFSSSWYQATVKVNGKWKTGYIHKNHVENSTDKQTTLNGVAAQSPTHIYSKASTESTSLKSYKQGKVLKYKTFSNDWYEARVNVNGEWRTGYIHKNHVDNKVNNQNTLSDTALKSPTNIYSSPSTGSPVLKSYKEGTTLKYKTYSNNWYEARVKVNGKWRTGYIYHYDVGKPRAQQSLEGIALNNPVNVYNTPSTNGKTLKSYRAGHVLKYKTYDGTWYEARVKVKGNWVTGYIHKNHVENTLNKKDREVITGLAAQKSTKVYSRASKSSSVLKSYKFGSKMKYNSYTPNWHWVTVKVNGKWETGYVHKNDVGFIAIDHANTSYNITLNQMIEAQANISPGTSSSKVSYTDMYVHKSALKKDKDGKWAITGKNIDVRSGPSNRDPIIGTIDKDKVNDPITVYRQVGDYYKFHTWIIATKKDIERNVNPNKFAQGSNDYYQFLVLSSPANVNNNEVNNKILRDKGILSGQAVAFSQAAKRYNVNELYLISHSLLETGNGTSALATGMKYNGLTVYNMYGIGASDACSNPRECGAKRAYDEGWFTVESAIIGGAEFIARNYINAGQDTLYKMRWNPESVEKNNKATHQYATDIEWAVKQTSRLTEFYELLSSYSITYDRPIYK